MWSKRELGLLSEMVGAVNCFSSDSDDEIRVIREDGSAQGVLKTWAAPFIAFLDFGKLDLLAAAWPVLLQEAQKGRSFEQAVLNLSSKMATEIIATIDLWNSLCQTNPDYFQRSLCRALNCCYVLDADLLCLYRDEGLASDPRAQLVQQLSRFRTAVGLLGPFYHIEALVANESSRWSALTGLPNTNSGGGELDALVFLLPAIFAQEPDDLDSKDLYLACEGRAEQMTKAVSPLSILLWKIAKVLGVSAVDVIFAAELLNQIPVRVGGKREDFDSEQAIARANELLSNIKLDGNSLTVAKNINAEIRFNNWLLETGGSLYEPRYDSICGPAREVKRILEKHPEFWRESFREVFAEQIAPQLEVLDAESAKGRLLYQLIVQDKLLSAEFYPLILRPFDTGLFEGGQPLVLLSEKTTLPRLYGDKAANLGVVHSIGPIARHRIEGFIAPVVTIDQIFFSSSPIRTLMCEIGLEEVLEKRVKLGQKIISLLKECDTRFLQGLLEDFISANGFAGEKLWAVRSSCFGEDNPNNPSAGIYKSVLRVGVSELAQAALETVCSWLSEIAISHRYLVAQSDLSLVAVIFQPYLAGQGGVVEVRENPARITVHVGQSAAAVTSGEIGSESSFQPDELVGDTMEVQVATLARELYEIFGELDLEWVYVDGFVKILQLKTYRKSRKTPKKVESWIDYDITGPTLTELLTGSTGILGLNLKGDVNLEAFQGELFGHIASLGPMIGAIALERSIPKACHFANICSAYGIALKVADEM